MKSIVIEGTLRTDISKPATRELKKAGEVPCEIYGGKENVSFSAPAKAFKALIYTPEFNSATIKVDGREFICVYKELQFDPVSDKLTHIDFVELVPGESLTLDIPVKLIGTPVGAKDGGKTTQKLKKLKVKLTSEKLVPHLEVNIEHLALGKSIRVGEVKFDGIEIVNAPNIPIASVFVPRVIKEEAPVAGAAAAAAPGAAPASGAPAAPGAAPAAGAPAAGKAAAPAAAKAPEKKK